MRPVPAAKIITKGSNNMVYRTLRKKEGYVVQEKAFDRVAGLSRPSVGDNEFWPAVSTVDKNIVRR